MFQDPINLVQLAGKADERRAQAAALKRLSRIGWMGFGTVTFSGFFLPIALIARSSSFISSLAFAITIAIGIGGSLATLGVFGTVQYRRIRLGLVLRREANELIRKLMPDLPEGHLPLLTRKSRKWYWFYFSGLVIISLAVFGLSLYPSENISNKLLPSFPPIPFIVIINLPQMTLWAIWHDLWMGQSILSIVRWIRHGSDPKRGLHCLIHGLSLITLTVVPLSILYYVGETDADLGSFGWIIIILIWIYQTQLLKYFIGFPHDWITKPLLQGRKQATLHRLNFMKAFRSYNPGLHQANAIIMSFSGQYVEAEQAYRNVLAENPPIENQILCLMNISASLLDQRKYQDAISVLDVVMHLAPETSVNYINLADIYLSTGSNPARALEILEVGIEQNDKFPNAKREKSRFEGVLWIAKA